MKLLKPSTFLPRLKSALSSFPSQKSGNVAMVYALAIIPILAAVGSAIDYNNTLRVKQQMQAAADSGVLAAVGAVDPTKAALTNAQVDALVKANITSNLAGSPAASPSITVTQNNSTVAADVSAPIPTHFMKLFGFSSITAHANSAAAYGGGNPVKVEVALVLDTTLSMSDNGKIDALKTAATSLVSTILPANSPGNSDKVKISLVPYTDYVNVGTTYKGASWLTNTADYTTSYAGSCYDTFPNAVYGSPIIHNDPCTYDGRPSTCTWTETPVISYGAPVSVCYPAGTDNHTWYGCVGSRDYPQDLSEEVTSASPTPALYDTTNCPQPLTRLTTDQAALTGAISTLTPSGETYIAPGLVWGWRTLSPKLPFKDGKPYSSNTLKYIVLMTDGFNTHSASPNGSGGWHENTDTAAADALTLETCTAIKAAGIKIFTVSFQVTNNTSAPMLKACASDNSYYYDAISNAALQSAFSNIANNIQGGFGQPHLVK